MKKLFALTAFFIFSSPLVFLCRAAPQKYVISIPPANEKTFQDKQEALKVSSDRLEALKKDVDARISKYQALLVQVQAAIKELNSLSGKAAAKLIKVYETMPPENTAQTLSGLDEAEAVRVILMMNPRKAAAVMAAMSPAKASAISGRILSLGKKIPIR